jgi:hypothetical protein
MRSSAALDAAGDLQGVAERLLGAPAALAAAAGGGNNRVWRVESRRGLCALKSYPRQAADPRDRLGAEYGALSFLATHGVECAPHPIACDRSQNVALYGWVEGERVVEPTECDIDAALEFIALLKGLSRAPDAMRLPLASAACLSYGAVAAQIGARLYRLRRSTEGQDDIELFLEAEFAPACAALSGRASAMLEPAEEDRELAPAFRVLSPSDFGFHNMLRRPDGALAFIDFEYFGWDDPAKLAADFLLHAGHDLGPELASRFEAGMRALFSSDPCFGQRLDALRPLFGLCWVLILLNEFVPERFARRAYAGAASDAASVRARQLQRARDLLLRLRGTHVGARATH